MTAEGESAVDQDAAETVLGNGCFECQQRPELRVAILLHNEAELVLREEPDHLFRERKSPDAHIIRRNPLPVKGIERLPHCWIAATNGYDTKLRTFPEPDNRWRYKSRGRGMFLQ